MILQFLIVCIIVAAALYILSLLPIDATLQLIIRVIVIVGFAIYAISRRSPGSEAMGAGRPSDYEDAFAEQATKLCALGATDMELADFFGVDVRTIYRWKHSHDEFCQALKAGKDAADERVERSLFQRATGYEQDEVKIFMPANAAAPVYATYRAKIAPDTTAAIFWLKNRRKDEWRDKQDVEHGVSGQLADLLARIDGRTRTVVPTFEIVA
jgi:hypothetical protein